MVVHRGPPGYRAYLLRCWQERPGPGKGAPVWRFSLEDPHTHTRHGFATFPELVAALVRDMDETWSQNQLQTQEENMTRDDQVEAAVGAVVKQVEAGWNAGDGDAFAAPFAENADYVVVDGRYIRGRAAIAEGHRHIFATVYNGSHNTATLHGVRLLRDNVAIAHVAWHLRFQEGDTPREGHAVNTMVLTREEGVWRIAAFQNTPLQSR